ncbi:hypothetical protein LCGC14_0849560 [marine sediment metagenome]|uniref:Uncharacterized protein n=1 Tax=marine sediment metagenome TaxID=412755 RepID=A0A0F9SHT3_9ZZZZ
MSKKKRSTKRQTIIATEVMEQQEHRKLKKALQLLKRLPKDFRDMSPGSPDWEAFADISGRRVEMTEWSRGPVIYFGELNKLEKMVLGDPNPLHQVIGRSSLGNTFTKLNWIEIINLAERIIASWIYLPNEEGTVIDALNLLLSRFDYKVRIKRQIKSEMSGKAIGTTY